MFTGEKPLAGQGPNGEDLAPIQFAFKIAAERIRPKIPKNCPEKLGNLVKQIL
jgi:hypothetical protein